MKPEDWGDCALTCSLLRGTSLYQAFQQLAGSLTFCKTHHHEPSSDSSWLIFTELHAHGDNLTEPTERRTQVYIQNKDGDDDGYLARPSEPNATHALVTSTSILSDCTPPSSSTFIVCDIHKKNIEVRMRAISKARYLYISFKYRSLVILNVNRPGHSNTIREKVRQ